MSQREHAARAAVIGWTSLLLVFVTVAGAVAQPCADYRQNLRVCGTTNLGFAASVIAMHGRVAYVAGADRLAAWDVSNPDAPEFLDDAMLAVPAWDIVASGSAVYVRGETQVVVYGTSNPAELGAPVVLGPFFDLLDIAASGDLLLVVREYFGLSIYDTTDPEAIQLVGQMPSDSARAVALRGNLALLAESPALRIIDLSDPAAPSILASYSQPATPDGTDPFFADVVAVSSGAAVIVGQFSGSPYPQYYTVSLDLSDPGAPRQVACGEGMTFDGALDDRLLRWGMGYLEVWTSAADLGVLKNAVVPFPGSDGMMAGADGVECGVNGNGQMLVIDARYPGFVTPLAPLAGGTMTPGWMLTSDLICDGGCDLQVRLFDMRDPFAPVQRYEVYLPEAIYGGGAYFLGTWGDRVAIRTWDGSSNWSHLCDLSVEPAAVAKFLEMWVVDVAGDRAFVRYVPSPQHPAVRIYDISNLATPALIGTIPDADNALALTPEIVLIPAGSTAIKVLDCTVPSSPEELATLVVGGTPAWWRRLGDRVFIGTTAHTLAVLDVTDPRAPTIAYLATVPGTPSDVVQQGDLAAVAMINAGVQIYRLYGVADVEPVGSLLPAQVHGGPDLAWVDDVLYAADDMALRAFDVGDPANAAYLGAGNAASCVYAEPGVLVIPYAVMPLHCDDVVAVEPLPAPSSPLIAAPNPFNPATTLRFRLAQGGVVDLAIYDLRGRRVRQLRHESLTAGDHAVAWDGRGEDGRSQAAGVYLARLSTDTALARTRLVLVK